MNGRLERRGRLVVATRQRQGTATGHMRIGELWCDLQRPLAGVFRGDQILVFSAVPLMQNRVGHGQARERRTVASVELGRPLKHLDRVEGQPA